MTHGSNNTKFARPTGAAYLQPIDGRIVIIIGTPQG
jgi:hypothetical protein